MLNKVSGFDFESFDLELYAHVFRRYVYLNFFNIFVSILFDSIENNHVRHEKNAFRANLFLFSNF